MQKIANKRLNSNARKQIHYLALVFNDFFVLALLLIFGALMFWYAKSIQTWPRNLWYYSPLLALVFSISFGFGSLVTLFEHADQQFLLSLDDQLEFYLKPMLKYSMVLPTIILLLVGGIAFPFAFLRMAIHPINYLILLVDMLLLKHVQHLLQEHSLYFNDKLHYNTIAFAVIGYFLILLGISQPLVLLAIIVVAMVYIIRQPLQGFNWNKAISQESQRKDRIDNFYSMFTDVQDKKITISRRKYLDFLISRKKQTANMFLFQRILLRDPEYSNLLLRMIVFALLLIFMIQDYKLNTFLAAIVIFLTIYQLLPVANIYERNMMYHVQPISRSSRAVDLAKVLQKFILLQWLLISIGLVISSAGNLQSLLYILGLFVLTLILLYVYLPVKIGQTINKFKR